MRIALIGAKGDMGKNLLLQLLQPLGEVLPVDRTTLEDEAVWSAAVIWLSIPREEVPKVLSGRKLRPDQLVVDICSLKRRLSEIVHQTGAAHLSLHPLHGPFVPLEGQRWAIVSSTAVSHPHAQTIIKFLTAKRISFVEAIDEDEHDLMLGLTLSMPEYFTLVLDYFIDAYAAAQRVPRPNFAKVMEWAVPASNALFASYIHSVNSSADWLRRDLVLGSNVDLLSVGKQAAAVLSTMTTEKVDETLARQRREVDTLPIEERTRIRQWIERWYVDATQNIFSFHRRVARAPILKIQEAKPTEEIFPNQAGLRVGIHGIEGSFSHESLLRLCQELQVDVNRLDIKYLVEAERVLDAVTTGRVDRGVFAVANSGSGAYVSSMRAMGSHAFDVLAVYGMEIIQCLLAHSSIERIDQLTEVFGHPQAVSQCKRTFAERYPKLSLRLGSDSDDTALCAERIASGELPRTTATLASQVAADKYGLRVLEYGMHHDPFNTTTFLIVRRTE